MTKRITRPHLPRGRKPLPPADRFWPKVEKTGGCWLWTGSKDRDGYGMFWDGVTMCPGGTPYNGRAHRWALEHIGAVQVPPDAFVCHSCDNPSCVNPAHLFVGSPADNSADMTSKGRSAVARNRHAKVTPEIVEQIRAAYKGRNDPPQRVLAERFGISQVQVGKIVNGRCWAHIGTPTST